MQRAWAVCSGALILQTSACEEQKRAALACIFKKTLLGEVKGGLEARAHALDVVTCPCGWRWAPKWLQSDVILLCIFITLRNKASFTA